jgi:hypothetical protein
MNTDVFLPDATAAEREARDRRERERQAALADVDAARADGYDAGWRAGFDEAVRQMRAQGVPVEVR